MRESSYLWADPDWTKNQCLKVLVSSLSEHTLIIFHNFVLLHATQLLGCGRAKQESSGYWQVMLNLSESFFNSWWSQLLSTHERLSDTKAEKLFLIAYHGWIFFQEILIFPKRGFWKFLSCWQAKQTISDKTRRSTVLTVLTLILMLWLLSECYHSALIALWHISRWRLTALDKLEPDERTNIVTAWAPVGAKNPHKDLDHDKRWA